MYLLRNLKQNSLYSHDEIEHCKESSHFCSTLATLNYINIWHGYVLYFKE